ncbi:MAG: 2-hydroxyhepta-2,4-diene-1,7-dioate isomerase [Chloroflexi bacterium RBG_16_63_12]|nr:MAG: 2-hydroxyhepta-2,4-diene-1,7-dioate isomerase [Chloroflexi bacterium RBG_16_63_12]
MQIVRYQKDSETHFGYLDGDRVGSLTGDIFGEFVRHRRKTLLAEVTLLAPVEPGKIIGVENNFVDRLREMGLPTPDLPRIYLRPPSAVVGPGEAICLPPQSQKVEYAAELAVVIGKRARRVTPDEALQFVRGYTCANDVTARDLVELDGVRARAKSFDATCPLGPNITTGLDPTELLITCKVNGETKQMSSTHDMLFNVPQVVAFVSSIMTLLPGDVLLMGTPAGAGVLADGDKVEVEIEGIGKLSNPVRAEGSGQ